MGFWACLTTYKGDGTDVNGETFVNVQGVPGEDSKNFCLPVEKALMISDGLINDDVLKEALVRMHDLGSMEQVKQDYPGAVSVVQWLAKNKGERVRRDEYRFFSY